MTTGTITYDPPILAEPATEAKASIGEDLKLTENSGLGITVKDSTGEVVINGNCSSVPGNHIRINTGTAGVQTGIFMESTSGHIVTGGYPSFSMSEISLAVVNGALMLPGLISASITSPINGMIYYDISDNTLKVYASGVWKTVTAV
jgi:hypothetical protein